MIPSCIMKGRYFILNSKKIFSKALLTSLFLTVLISQINFQAECESISSRVLRLHIIAHSDSEDDQQLKLKVRDFILQKSENLFRNAKSKEEAEHIVENNLSQIISDTQNYVYRSGYTYQISGALKHNVYFNTRVYDKFTLPAEKYDALQIKIGQGRGHNWWCVMFPPMCFSAAEESGDLSDVLSEEQLSITENGDKYEYKFKIAEWYQMLENWF